MGILILHLMICTTTVAFFARSPRFEQFQPPVLLLFSPIVLGLFFFAILPMYWQVTLGPTIGPSDDGRGFGSALLLLVAFPTTLVLNLVVYATRYSSPTAHTETSE